MPSKTTALYGSEIRLGRKIARKCPNLGDAIEVLLVELKENSNPSLVLRDFIYERILRSKKPDINPSDLLQFRRKVVETAVIEIASDIAKIPQAVGDCFDEVIQFVIPSDCDGSVVNSARTTHDGVSEVAKLLAGGNEQSHLPILTKHGKEFRHGNRPARKTRDDT